MFSHPGILPSFRMAENPLTSGSIIAFLVTRERNHPLVSTKSPKREEAAAREPRGAGFELTYALEGRCQRETGNSRAEELVAPRLLWRSETGYRDPVRDSGAGDARLAALGVSGARRRVPAEDRAFATRLARYCARHPVALGRLAYRADTGTVTYQSDKASGPAAGAETMEALEFLARVVSHIPNKGQVLQRYYGWYANRTRGIRRRADVPDQAPTVAAEAAPPALADARRRWAELLRRIFEVDPLRCPRCGHQMRIIGFITQPGVIDRILTHLRRTAIPARRSRAPPRRRTAPRTTTSA